MVTLAYNLSLYNVLLTSSTMMCCLLSMTSVLLERRATLHRSQTLCCHFSVSERSIIKVRFVLRQRSAPSSDGSLSLFSRRKVSHSSTAHSSCAHTAHTFRSEEHTSELQSPDH